MTVRATEFAEVEKLRLKPRLALTLEILRLYLHMRWLLLRSGLTSTVTTLRGTGVPDADIDEVLARIRGRRLAHATVRALRVLPTDGRCLMRSLVLTGLLARRGIPSTFVIGVDPGPDFAAHAWVEHEGTPLIEAGEFHRLLEL